MLITESLSRIKRYDFGFLADRFAADHPAYAARFGEYTLELGKFLQLPLLCDGPLAAMSEGVDGVWHDFIVHTPQYRDFCQEVYGGYLQHQPRSALHPVPIAAISNFYTLYPQFFGPVPEIWFENIPTQCIEQIARGEVPEEVQLLRWSGWPGKGC